jgi:hypothetical protein
VARLQPKAINSSIKVFENPPAKQLKLFSTGHIYIIAHRAKGE